MDSDPAKLVDTERCDLSGVERPAEVSAEDYVTTWQPMPLTALEARVIKTKPYVVSAHLDTRWTPAPLIKFIGISTIHMLEVYCRVWYREVDSPDHIRGIFHFITGSQGKQYAEFIGSCPLASVTMEPYAVTLLRNACDASTPNLLYLSVPPRHHVNFTVCVSPLNFAFNNYRQVVEMIEVNRLFGAQRFVFYNYSTGPLVRQFLDAYRDDGLVTVVQWHVPVTVDVWPPDPRVYPAVHYFAQLCALNDCLYRSIGSSTFVVNTDIDEILVPRQNDSWAAMLDAVSDGEDPEAAFPGGYMFRSSFFRTDWPSDDDVPRAAVQHNLLTLLKTWRETKVFRWPSRSKCVFWTKAALIVGVHGAVRLVPTADSVHVDDRTALVHHYRLWFDDPGNPPVVDRYLHRFKDYIVDLVDAQNALMEARVRATQVQRRRF